MTDHYEALLDQALERSGERCEDCKAVHRARAYVDPAGSLRTCSRTDEMELRRHPGIVLEFLHIDVTLAWDGANPSTCRAVCWECIGRGDLTPYPPF